MNDLTITRRPAQPRTFVQWIAAVLQAVASRLDPAPAPSASDVAKHQIKDVELALLDAKAECERYTHTVNMLEERLRRLKQ